MSRWRVTFWLDDKKDHDYNVGMLVRELKTQRQFTSVVRDGIRLIVDLRAKRLDVLRELFPWIDDALNITPPATPGDDLKREIETAVKSAVKTAFLEAPAGIPAPPPNYPAMKPVSTGNREKIHADDEDTVILKKDESATGISDLNFLKNAFGLRGEDIPDSLKKSQPATDPPKGIKTMDVPQFEKPTFDDEDDDFIPAPVKKMPGQVSAVQ